MRSVWVLVHRYVGLVMAGFLLVAGLTGALMVWYQELDRTFSADIQTVPMSSAALPALDPYRLRDEVNARLQCATIAAVDLRRHPNGMAVSMGPTPGKDPSTGQLCELGYDEIFVDPATGHILGRRRWGDLAEGWHNVMPFVYRLHYQLALGVVGSWAFGVVALLWTLDCFVGAYLTMPARSRSRGGRSWPMRWWPAWTVRTGSGTYKLNFDLHRAGGLWPWALLLVFAWSSVALNFSEQVYKPLMRTIFVVSERDGDLPLLKEPLLTPPMTLRAAQLHGRELLEREGRRLGFTWIEDTYVAYDAARGIYEFSARTTADIRDRAVFTQLSFDASTGELRNLFIPTGRYAGDTITMWLYALHLADVWGLPYRVFVCILGVVVAVLSVTGVVIWWKKRRSHAQYSARRGACRSAT